MAELGSMLKGRRGLGACLYLQQGACLPYLLADFPKLT